MSESYVDAGDGDDAEPPPEVEGVADRPDARGEPAERVERRSAAALLVELAVARYELGVTPDGQPYGRPRGGAGRHIVRMLRGDRSGLRAELSDEYYVRHGRVAPAQALADAMLVLQGRAQAADPRPVCLRVAEHGGVSWIDTGRPDGAVIRIGRDGWRAVTDDVPVLYRRTNLTGALPIPPSTGGEVSRLWRAMNIAEQDRPMVLAWLVAAMIAPDIPHPVLALFAEHGSGKSSATRCLVSLVDPSPVLLRKAPRDADAWVTAASASWVVALDNLSDLPAWLSDTLCRAATGDGDVRRALYTDGDVVAWAFRRAVIVNGIDVGAMRGDFADRAVVAQLHRIAETDRRDETAMAAEWVTEYPLILAGLLDLAAGVMAALPSVRLGSMPRMADYARIVAAVDQVLGTSGLGRYVEQGRTLAVDSIESDPLAIAIRTRITSEVTATGAELLALVRPTDDGWRPPRGWPRDGRAVTGTLRRIAPALRTAGWTVEDLGAANRAKTITWRLIPPSSENGPDRYPRHPQDPSSQVNGGDGRGDSAGVAGMRRDSAGDDAGDAGIAASLHPRDKQALTSDDGSCGHGGHRSQAISGDDQRPLGTWRVSGEPVEGGAG